MLVGKYSVIIVRFRDEKNGNDPSAECITTSVDYYRSSNGAERLRLLPVSWRAKKLARLIDQSFASVTSQTNWPARRINDAAGVVRKRETIKRCGTLLDV